MAARVTRFAAEWAKCLPSSPFFVLLPQCVNSQFATCAMAAAMGADDISGGHPLRLLAVIAMVALLTLVGTGLRRWLGWGDKAARRLNNLVLNFTLPVGIFVSMHNAQLGFSALKAPAAGWILTLLLLGLGWLLAGRFKLERRLAVTFMLTATFGNTAFLGYPAVVALFGEKWLPQAMLIDQLGSGALAVTLGAFIAASAATRPDDPFRWQVEIARILRFPPLLALGAGSLWRLTGVPALPDSLTVPMRLFGTLTVPVVMVAFGLLIRADALRQAFPSAYGVIALRLVISPLLMWGLCLLLGVDLGTAKVATLQMSVPTMMLTLMLAIRYDLEPQLTAAYILATFVVSMVTMPLLAFLLA